MSTTSKPSTDHRTGPVTGQVARRSWRYRLATRLAPSLAAAADTIDRLTADIQHADEQAHRWAQHADSFAQDRERAVQALAGRIRERDVALSERAQLLAWLAALHPASAVITPAHDGDGTQVLYLVAAGWQLSWHITEQDADLFQHVTVVEVTDPRAQWDGHGPAERSHRIRQHVRLLALEADAGQMLLKATEARAELSEVDRA